MISKSVQKRNLVNGIRFKYQKYKKSVAVHCAIYFINLEVIKRCSQSLLIQINYLKI